MREEFKKLNIQYSGVSVDLDARNLTEAIKLVVAKSVPRVKFYNNKDKIWTNKLQKARSLARKLRRIYQKSNIHAEREVNLRKYRDAKEKYKILLEETRRKYWENFVEQNIKQDIWGQPYKIIMDKIKKPEIITTLDKGNGEMTENWKESVELLLNTLLPDDDKELENDIHLQSRRQMMLEYRGNVIYPFDVTEIK